MLLSLVEDRHRPRVGLRPLPASSPPPPPPSKFVPPLGFVNLGSAVPWRICWSLPLALTPCAHPKQEHPNFAVVGSHPWKQCFMRAVPFPWLSPPSPPPSKCIPVWGQAICKVDP